MDRLNNKNQSTGTGIFVVLIWLLAFQSPLESVWDPFSYIDEFIPLIGVFLCVYDVVIVRKFKINRTMLSLSIPVCIFAAVGVAGNILFQYQPWKSVVIDLYSNLKFFFAILTGYYLFRKTSWKSLKKQACLHGRIITAFIFAVFLVDRVFHFWPFDIRYGIMSAKLFYYHPTYLAGAMAFLIVLLTAFYEKRNLSFIAMALVVMSFTMRSKAIASAAAYVVFFLFFAMWKLKTKWWQIAVLGIITVIVAWPQISFYFIQLGGRSTRSVMHSVSFQILQDYFPIGTGFGTYASSEAAKHFSPVYEIYNFEYLLRFEKPGAWVAFLNDTFWPIIIGQTGLIGSVAYVIEHLRILNKCFRVKKYTLYGYVAVLFLYAYLLISSVAEPAFNNAIAIPLALILGMVLQYVNTTKQNHGRNYI